MNTLTMMQSWLTSPSVTEMVVTLKREMASLISFMALILAWQLLRPSMIRDYDNRPMPNFPTARIAFALACGLLYLALAGAYMVFSPLAEQVMSKIWFLNGFQETFRDEPAMLAAVTFLAVLQIPFLREVERGAIIWLHNRRQTHDDLNALAEHLMSGPFQATQVEQRKNRDFVKPFGIYLTESTFEDPGLTGFAKWRKTSTLLRLVREWNADEKTRALDDGAMDELADIETAHLRKTELAINIIKMVNEVQQGGEASKALAVMLKLLNETPHVDRASVAAAEARAKMLLSGAEEQSEAVGKPLRLSNEQLKSQLSHIERYFQVEYQILLEDVAVMAARSVVTAGDRAPARLEQLKAAGVGGLGSIQRYDFNRVSWAFLGVFFLGFLVMYLGFFPTMNRTQAEGLARFALGMSIATIIGALVGSRRRWVRAPHTQWAIYIGWGVVAGACFVAISLISNLIKATYGDAPVLQAARFNALQLLPWTLLPCVTTIVIARLARMRHWPRIAMFDGYRAVYVRFFDGLSVCLAIYLAYCLAIALHPLFGLTLPPTVQAMMDAKHRLPIPINWAVQTVGFMIGALVVRDVRWAAHSTIVAEQAGHIETTKDHNGSDADRMPPAKAA